MLLWDKKFQSQELVFVGRFRQLIKSKSNKNSAKKKWSPEPTTRNQKCWFRNALILISLRHCSSVRLAELLGEESLAWDKQCLNWLREDSVQIYFCLQGDIISSFISPLKFFFSPEHLWVNFRAHKNEEVISPARAKCRMWVGSYVIEILNQSYFFPQPGLFCWFQTSEEKIASGTFPHFFMRCELCSYHGQTVLQSLEHDTVV